MTEDATGLIFDIKRFAVHDGPGIRTTVFFKGCPLRCIWCHNPEAVSSQPELATYPDKCIVCGACLASCPVKAHEAHPVGKKTFYRDRCTACGRCVDTCYTGALALYGKKVSVGTVMAEIRPDASFYRNSGGGVTFSGGEPLVQHTFVLALLKQCRQEGFHTALDTCGYAPWHALEACLPYLDLILYDLKHIDSGRHKRYTGVPNKLILENLINLNLHAVPVEIRIPVIPCINDSRENIETISRFIKPLKHVTGVRLLPYHPYAGSKYERLDKKNTMPGVDAPDKNRLDEIAGWIKPFGLPVIVF